ncbi:hypothetical protein HYH03_007607 [Edaphochlamys debaryana]|uniref:Uncharacterized protein n=1 Tax=Edaphochlamys debaryana TaxID=47281 RepID=A0A835Y077_9CHLO|nr:hypothetical protein HYH03_007607 [Edaphochlamys debaryana]|eukprot:KAG2494252.1 hypothetical protein HYH03_007607 [Edaphochlamys debaryana]
MRWKPPRPFRPPSPPKACLNLVQGPFENFRSIDWNDSSFTAAGAKPLSGMRWWGSPALRVTGLQCAFGGAYPAGAVHGTTAVGPVGGIALAQGLGEYFSSASVTHSRDLVWGFTLTTSAGRRLDVGNLAPSPSYNATVSNAKPCVPYAVRLLYTAGSFYPGTEVGLIGSISFVWGALPAPRPPLPPAPPSPLGCTSDLFQGPFGNQTYVPWDDAPFSANGSKPITAMRWWGSGAARVTGVQFAFGGAYPAGSAHGSFGIGPFGFSLAAAAGEYFSTALVNHSPGHVWGFRLVTNGGRSVDAGVMGPVGPPYNSTVSYATPCGLPYPVRLFYTQGGAYPADPGWISSMAFVWGPV